MYAFESADEEALKKLLAYDPYLDKNLIPSMPPELSNKDYLEAHPEMKAKAEELSRQIDQALEKLRNDKEANIIFARQDYVIKSGSELGLDPNLQYLYLNFPDEQWDLAEKKLKDNIKSIKRLGQEEESKAISAIDQEREKSDQGLGLIFG